jgi:hypothetical protein
VEHRQHGTGLERRTVIAVQHRPGLEDRNAFRERRTAHEMSSVFGSIAVVHLPADNLDYTGPGSGTDGTIGLLPLP